VPSVYYIERNGKKYAYESISKRIHGRKNPKTEIRYLGRVNPETGEIIPKQSIERPKEEFAKFYGAVEALDGIQKQMHLYDDLKSIFGSMAPNIMGAAMALAISPSSFDSLHYTVEGSTIREKYNLRGMLSPSSIGELSEEVGSMMYMMDRFFEKRIKRSGSPFYSLDLTSVSTYSDMGGWAQWGHNRDEEDLKQTNIAMITDKDGIPVMVNMLPGSIADMAILKPTVDNMKKLGCKGRLVIDRGFESAENVASLLDMKIDFTIPSNAKAEPIKKLLSLSLNEMKQPSAFAFHEGCAYKFAEFEVGVVDNNGKMEYIIHAPQNQKDSKENNNLFEKSKKLKAFVVYDGYKANNDLQYVMTIVRETELMFENTNLRYPEKTYQSLSPSIRKYLGYYVDKDGTFHLERKQNAFTFADNRAGLFVMLTSTNTTFEQMMTSYDVRDWVEKAFDVYKNDLDGGRARTGNPERARGRLFIKFIALIMRIRIQNILRNHDSEILGSKKKKDSVNGMTVNEVILSLSTLYAIGIPGNWRLTAVSKNVREIFRLFGLEEPESGAVVIS